MIQKGPSNPNLRAVSCNWIIHYMWQLFLLEADWEINNQGIKSRTVKLLFLFPLWPITSPQFKHLQCHSELWHFMACSDLLLCLYHTPHTSTVTLTGIKTFLFCFSLGQRLNINIFIMKEVKMFCIVKFHPEENSSVLVVAYQDITVNIKWSESKASLLR